MNKPQLFILHFAGGNCYSYQFFYPYLKSFEVIALELPGRGNRMEEPLIKNYEEAVADYYLQIAKKRKGNDFVIYGHSMGATLGWEVGKKLEENNIFPVSLILSGNPGPGITKNRKRYKLSRNEFDAELKDLGGMPQGFFESEELYEFLEPVLRADFEILEKDQITSNSSIKQTPVIVLMGSEEEDVDQINNWRKYCDGPFFSKIMEGNHFFIHNYPKEIAENIQMVYDKSFVFDAKQDKKTPFGFIYKAVGFLATLYKSGQLKSINFVYGLKSRQGQMIPLNI